MWEVLIRRTGGYVQRGVDDWLAHAANSPMYRVYISTHRTDDDLQSLSSFQGTARPNSWGNAMSTATGLSARRLGG